jgi:hypothetical protein
MTIQPDSALVGALAQAVLERWDSPNWGWDKYGHTANIMADLRKPSPLTRPSRKTPPLIP